MSETRHLEAVPPEDEPHTPTLPHDDAAERAVIGALLSGDPHALTDITTTLTARDYYHPRHELIHDAALWLYSRGTTPDVIAVTDRLRTTNSLSRAGGPAYLHELRTSAIITANAGHYADIVRATAERRRYATALLAGYTRALNPALDDTTTDLRAHIDQALDQARTTIPGLDPGQAHPWAPVDLADILDNGEQLEHPTVLQRTDGHHLLYPSAVHSIAGEPESGKTWVALIAAAQELREGNHVTYVDFEDRAGRVIPRLVNLGATRLQIIERFHYIRPLTALDPAGGHHLDQAAAQSTLAVIDGVTEAMTLHGLSLMDNEDAARFLDLLPRRLAEQGPAVLQIDHVVKDSERQGRWAIGAGHKLAGLDGAAYGVKIIDPFGRGKTGRARITVSKDRPGAVREHASGSIVAELVLASDKHGALSARLEEPSTAPRGADGELRPTHLMQRVSEAIEGRPGLSGQQVEASVKGKAEYIRLALKTLVIEGYVITENGPRGAIYYHPETPFREDADAPH